MTGPAPLLVIGAGGRMGREILEIARTDPAFRVAAALGRRLPVAPLPGDPPVFVDLEAALRAAPGAVAVDLSSPAGAADRIARLAAAGCPLVEGTTALDSEAEAALGEAARRIAVVRAPNLSVGIALLRRALRTVLAAGAAGWEIALEERHHRGKKDAPSGTALLLAAEIAAHREPGAPPPAITSLREGEVVGEHTVALAGPDETLVLAHRAGSRRLFARGALRAARFAAGARPGLYGMDDVLEAQRRQRREPPPDR